MRFNFVQLRAFLAAADTLNFTVAADRVHVAQPSFSATIRNLEDEIGTKLFERNSRKVRLTPMGLEFVPLARRVIAEVERASSEMSDLVTMRRGSVRFSALPVLYDGYLQDALARYHTKWPAVRLSLFDLSSANALDRLRREQLDLAIATQVESDKEFNFHPLCEWTIVAVMPRAHPLAKVQAIEWKQLLKEQTITLRGTGPMARYAEDVLLEAGINFEPAYDVEQLSTAAGLMAAGMGIAVVSNVTAGTLARKGLITRELVRPRVVRPLSLVRLAGRELPPAGAQLHDFVTRYWTGPRMPDSGVPQALLERNKR